MVGKTFKGLTDELLRWQTEQFQRAADVSDDGHVVTCAPSSSSRSRSTACRRRPATPAASRCASPACARYRDDKSPADADTIDAVRAMLPARGPVAG